MRAVLPVMLLVSGALHVLGLLAFATFGASLWVTPAPSPLLVTELIVPPATAEPIAPVVPTEPVTPPPAATLEEPAALPAAPLPEPPPVEPPKVEPVTPPKLVARPMPQRLKAQPKPAPPEPKKLPSEPLASRPPKTSRAVAERELSLPGSPLPALTPPASPGNVLGPTTERPPASTPLSVEGGAAGAGKLFERGDAGVIPGTGAGGGSGGPGRAGLGSGGADSGAGTRVAGIPSGAGGAGAGSGLARPLGGYQVKPRYPETARRQGVEGTTVLKVSVSDKGLVDEVLVERSAGYRDLDLAALEAVRQWRFEPAKQGRQAVAVWVMLPVRFTLR